MNRTTRWLLAAAMLAPAACAPRAGRRETTEQETRDPAAYRRKLQAYYAGIPEAVEAMLPRIRAHARALADLGPRQTGQEGCAAALAYVRRALAEAAPECPVTDLPAAPLVTVSLDRTHPEHLDQIAADGHEFTHVVVRAGDEVVHRWPAYALAPNCVQACATHPPGQCAGADVPTGTQTPCRCCEVPRRIVDLRRGRWEDFRGKDPDGALVLLDFNSGEAWLRAASMGAAGVLFVAPARTTVFQADAKYLAVLPLNVPRAYLRREHGLALRKAAAGNEGLRVVLKSRLAMRNVPAGGLELTIPGRDRSYGFVLAGHVDARCIACDLSYGAAEVWGIAELIELTRYLAANPPACDIRVLFVSGHWQSQRVTRELVARGGPDFERIGRHYKLAMAVDLVPEGRSVNLITEGMWDVQGRGMYRWLGNRLFNEGGWRDRIFVGLDLPGVPKETPKTPGGTAPKSEDWVEMYGGARPFLSETNDGNMANRQDRSAFVFAPRYPTAEQAFQALALPTFAFQTARLTRLAHFTPLDRLGPIEPEATDGQLRPQLKIALGVLRHLMDYPASRFADRGPSVRRGRGWGGYARLNGRVLQWDRSIGWFAERLPGGGEGKPLKTFLHAWPAERQATRLQGTRLRNYMHWPMSPSRVQHREMQSFMFQDLRLLETSRFDLKTVYAAFPSTTYDVVAYTLDDLGRIRWATDYGVHGDGNKAFQCTDMELAGQETYVPVSLFECGALELFGLIDPQRYNPRSQVYGAYYHNYGQQHADAGVAPHLRVSEVKSVDTHTDLERWGFTQQGPTAMLFLPDRARVGAEIILGSYFTNIAVLNNPDPDGVARGFSLDSGQTRRLAPGDPTALACVRQLRALDADRLAEFRGHRVTSPLANDYHADSADAVAEGRDALADGRHHQGRARFQLAWIFESKAYRETLKLLLDVVATTVLYFVLLIPFSFLIERLLFPQRTPLRTVLVAACIFVAFAALLYFFHPGFQLAHNVVVTTTAFVIVVMTIPALVLLLMRGIAMLRAIGSKRVITQRSEAEGAGVVMASLSLAVSNMRRRRLRTALTLLTITALVVALVLLTTSSAFDFRILEPSGAGRASVQGLQLFNALDRRQPLLTEAVEMCEGLLADKALCVRRESINYGYNPDLKHNGAAFLTANGRRVPIPYLQLMDWRDDLVTYAYTFKEEVPRPGPGEPAVRERTVRIHLSDLFRERFAGEGDFIDPPAFHGRGDFLDEGDVDVALLPNNIAEALGVDVGDTVTLMGLPLTVKGVFAARSEQKVDTVEVTDLYDRLTGLPALPMTAGYVAGLAALSLLIPRLLLRGRKGLRRTLAGAAVFCALGAGLYLLHPGFRSVKTTRPLKQPKTIYVPGAIDRLTDLDGLPITAMRGAKWRQGEPDNPIHAPAHEIAIVPRAWARKVDIFPSVVHSLLVVPNEAKTDPSTVTAMAEQMAADVLNVDVYINPAPVGAGAAYAERISMHTATHVKGSTLMLVVLAVAVLMILAIMTGTVYERVREIHIFSSVGLSPRHVAGMFLIEALVYAGIAAVVGYFLGIICLKVLLWHLKDPEFYPNYLGVFVVYSTAIAVLATVASSLYPIRLASKIVSPSEGKWQLAGGSGEDHWHIRLPFIATTWEEARSMMVYAHDYLVIHQGERSGRFVCERPPAGRRDDRTIALAMPVWLAPFERNLSQDAELRAAPAADADWWELWLDLTRRSGPPYLWRRGATVFVNMLCKHLLRWRAATEEQEADCLRRADEIFPA